MSQWLNLGQLATRAGRLLPTITNLTSWLTQPTQDGTTLNNAKGVDAELTDVNCLSFDGLDDVLVFPSTLDFEDDKQYSVTLTFDPTAGTNTCFFASSTASNSRFAISMASGDNTKLVVAVRQASFTTVETPFSSIPSGMITLTASWDGSSTLTASYVDSSGSTTNFTSSSEAAITSGTAKTVLGARSSLSSHGILNSSMLIINKDNALIGKYPLAEGSGTKVYDISGNGNHGTITGATWTTEDGIESWNHEYGFDEDGSVKVPALNTKTKQVATFDGVADKVVTGVTAPTSNTVNLDITAKFIMPTVGGAGMGVVGNGTFGNSFGIMCTGQKVIVGVRGSSGAKSFESSTITAGTIVTARLQYDPSLTNGFLGTVNSESGTDADNITGNISNGDIIEIGSTDGCLSTYSGFFEGKILSVSYTQDGVKKFNYDFQNDIGTTTVQDLTTNDNDGTVTVGSGGLDSFWGQRVADNDGVLVSADYATGNTSISNPAGFVHNNSECGVKLQSRTVGTFDGVADKVDFDLGTFNTSAFNVKATIKTAGTLQSLGDLFSQAAGTGTGRAWVRINSNGSATTFLGGQGSTVLAPSGTFTASTKYDIELIYNGSNSLQLKTTTGGTTTTHTAVTRTVEESTGAFRFFVGHTGAAPLEGTAFSMEVVGLTKVNFSEAQGTTLTDLSGNDNNGTLTVGSGGTETFWANSYREYPNVLSSYSFIPSNITVTGLSDANANTTYFLSGYGELVSGNGFYWIANNDYYIALDEPDWFVFDDGGNDLSTIAGATLLPAEGSWSNSAVIAHSTQGLFIKTSGTNITQIGQYDEDEVLTATEATRNERYFG